jgi:hypothetical protein
VRRKANFASDSKLIWSVQSFAQKYLSLRKSEDVISMARPALIKRGVRVVTNVERGMRWTRRHQRTSDVEARQSLLDVPKPSFGRRRLAETGVADGEIVRS